MLSVISEHIERHKISVDKNKTTIKLETISLTDLLKAAIPHSFIEYMSLDTEYS